MFRRIRPPLCRRSSWLLTLLLLLSALLLLANSCETLDADAATTSTLAESADMADLLFGTWEGTYTPDAAWDENGVVDDPPFDIGTPVDMTMELRPWSAETASYGTIGADELYPANVVSLELEDDLVTIIAVTEASGLDDLVGVFELTLDGDTLTGSDDSEPQVPSGWVSSSGTVYLTRTTAWDASATETTVAPESGGSGDDAADDADDGAAHAEARDDGDEVEPLPGVEVVPDPEGPTRSVLGIADNGETGVVQVGDSIVVHFGFFAEDLVTDVFCSATSSVILEGSPNVITRDSTDTYIFSYGKGFDALASGSADIIVRATKEDGTVHLFWRYHVIVEEGS